MCLEGQSYNIARLWQWDRAVAGINPDVGRYILYLYRQFDDPEAALFRFATEKSLFPSIIFFLNGSKSTLYKYLITN
jgi:hypothetical protein